jgi:AmpD protein
MMIDTFNTFKKNNYDICLQRGLLLPVNYQPSPHQDDRPDDMPIDMVVIHGISLPAGEFGTPAIQALFMGQLEAAWHPSFAALTKLQVSSHLLIKRTGETIQFVPFQKRAWHAGVSFFQNRTRCNDFSIGIELEGTDDLPYEPVQYERLISIVRLLMQVYPAITLDRIVGHQDIAPDRKTDPGPFFDWMCLRNSLIKGS